MKKDISIDDVVEDLLKKHKGGQKFFTALDERVRKRAFMSRILAYLENEPGLDGDEPIVATGKFGVAFNNYCTSFWDREVLLVPGGLRRGRELNLSPFKSRIQWRRFVFVDDSFYSGRTLCIVRDEIARLGGSVVLAVVIYDGSKVQSPGVRSLYRYYDKKKVSE